MAMPEVQEEKWIELLSINPRKLFGLPGISITENAAAAITVFDPGASWKAGDNGFRSRSKNTPFTGWELKGKLIGIINKEQLFLNS
jgi:dihydroorotase